MDEVLPLRRGDICSRIANARPTNRFRDEKVGILTQLEQISKQLTHDGTQDASDVQARLLFRKGLGVGVNLQLGQRVGGAPSTYRTPRFMI